MIGTPFKTDDEQLQRKVNRINKKPWEQEVRDEKGRRRFHGAFTGGFSSGYFNTAGSKEGWKPSNYISSKHISNQISKTEQTVLDFMDEEDIQDQVGSHTITSKDGYKDYFHNKEISKTKSIISGTEAIFSEFLPQYNNVLGNKLMIIAGYDQAKRRTKNIDEFEKEAYINSNKYYGGKLEFKDDYYGYGYLPGHYDVIEKKDKDLFVNSNRISMDRLDDDYDSGYYNSNNISEYNFEEMLEDYDDTKKRYKNDSSNILRQNVKYSKSNHKLQTSHQLNFELPKLPKDYDPFKPLENNIAQNDKSSEKGHYKMNPERRSQILNYDMSQGNIYLNSKFSKAEEKVKSKYDTKTPDNFYSSINNIKPPSSTDQIQNYFNFKIDIPFKDDFAKVSRFAKFIAEKEGLIIGESYYGNTGNLTTASQIREERSLFEKLYEEEQKFKQAEEGLKTEIRKQNKLEIEMAEDAKSINKENNTVKREKIKWQPDKILCKRFKLKDPFENVVNTNDNKNLKNLNELQKEIFKEEARIHNYQHPHHRHPSNNPEQDLKMINNDKNSFLIINAKPDLNLFEEIFGN
jgi:hypothetical protein